MRACMRRDGSTGRTWCRTAPARPWVVLAPTSRHSADRMQYVALRRPFSRCAGHQV